jgi:hypothetical protein
VGENVVQIMLLLVHPFERYHLTRLCRLWVPNCLNKNSEFNLKLDDVDMDNGILKIIHSKKERDKE